MANIIDPTRPEQVELKPVEIEGMGRLEDSRTKTNKVTHPRFALERTYCTNCGTPYGWVSQESCKYIAAAEVIVFCDKCDEEMRTKLGPIPLECAGGKETTEFKKLGG